MKVSMVINCSDYTVRPSDNFFFDANAWLYIFAPLSEYNPHKQQKYSKLFEQIIEREAIIWINSMVISEIANVILRDRFRKYKKDTNNNYLRYKEFWETETKRSCVQQVKNIIEVILENEYVLQKPDNFNTIDVTNDLDKYYGVVDFNDAYIAHVCIENDYIVVTEDRDFIQIKELTIIK